jgi:hypothetical protein
VLPSRLDPEGEQLGEAERAEQVVALLGLERTAALRQLDTLVVARVGERDLEAQPLAPGITSGEQPVGIDRPRVQVVALGDDRLLELRVAGCRPGRACRRRRPYSPT